MWWMTNFKIKRVSRYTQTGLFPLTLSASLLSLVHHQRTSVDRSSKKETKRPCNGVGWKRRGCGAVTLLLIPPTTKGILPSRFQGCHFTDGAEVLQRKPLFDATGMELVPTIQYPNVFPSCILLLVHVKADSPIKSTRHLTKPVCVQKKNVQMALTWHIQQGSMFGSEPLVASYLCCFIEILICSSLSPVLTFPICSSKANNSCRANWVWIRMPPTFISFFFYPRDSDGMKYLIRHIVDIKPHISVSVVQLSISIYERINKHIILKWNFVEILVSSN